MSEQPWPDGLDGPDYQDRRNVIDHFKYWTDDAIRAELDTHRHPVRVLLENHAHDFNIGSCVRNANAFLAERVVIAGRRQWDRRGAVGTHHYTWVEHAPSASEPITQARADGYRIVAVDNRPGAVDVFAHAWDPKTLLLFGQESIGLSPDALAAADACVYIPQYGSTRSLNVAVACGIVLALYTNTLEQQGMAVPRRDTDAT